MSVGLLCAVIGHTVGFRQGKWPGSVWEETTERKERHRHVIKRTKIGEAFAENQWISECSVESSLQALKSQFQSIQWTPCWSSDPQVKDVWMRKEQVDGECNRGETQMTLECPRWNVSAAKCLASAWRGRAVDQRVIFTKRKCYFVFKPV